jgi:DNA polymerase V
VLTLLRVAGDGTARLVEVVSQFATRVAEKARQQQPRLARCMCSSPPAHSARTTGSTARASLPLVRPSADTRVIVGTAVRAVQEMYRPGFNYAKAGVMLVDLRPQGQQQGELDLFPHYVLRLS